MRLDRTFLAEHASHVSDGVEERAFFMEIGRDRCFALLYLPPEPRSLGFLACHSYGLELLTLRRAERAIGLTLARLGYPVLSFHRRAYGDSTGSLADATLDSQLEDVRAAAECLSAEAGTSQLGLFGARFGGLIAGVAASEGGVERLLLVNPALTGRDYIRQMIREMHMVQIAIQGGESRRSMDEIMRSLQDEGIVDVLGYPIYRGLFDDLSAVDLTADVGEFSGRALAIQVSKGTTVQRDLTSFAERVQAGGGGCRIELVREPAGARFGGAAYVSTGDPTTRVDVQAPILEGISSLTQEWMQA